MTVSILISLLPWVSLVAGIMISAGIDPYINRRTRRIILIINGLVLLLMMSNVTEYVISNGSANDQLRTFASAFGYAVRPILLVLFHQILYPNQRIWPLWALAGINAAIYFLSIFTGTAFSIVDNAFQRGPLNRSCLIVSMILLLELTRKLICTSHKDHKKEIILILFSTGLIALGVMIDASLEQLQIISFLCMGIIGSIIFYYLWLHLQLARQHEEKMVESIEEQHRVQLAISQIQPHFLYNTLASIQVLCETDPQKAAELTEHFSLYLRQNLASLNRQKLVPIEKEIEHTKTYLEIEQVRFPSIQITYDLRDMEFDVPVLTIQPLVENSIRHGVRIREIGLVQIASWFEENHHVIMIRDNGKGFDVEKASLSDDQHIGLRSVQERVEQMCGGTMEIESKLGEGTVVTLRFPHRKRQA